jgi:hypothetical protein
VKNHITDRVLFAICVGLLVVRSGVVQFGIGLPLVSEPTQVVYVYSKDAGPVPRPVAGALMDINANEKLGIEATEFEHDTTDGDGDVPEQYRAAKRAAEAAGLPAVVVLAGGRVIATVKAPSTHSQIMELIK